MLTVKIPARQLILPLRVAALFIVFHYNVAEAQLELHRQNMEWCIGTIAKARHRHVDDVEPEFDGETGRDLGLNTDPKLPV